MDDFKPFADDATAITIGGLTIENGRARIAVSGALDITRDRLGLEQVEALKTVVDKLHGALLAGLQQPDNAVPAVAERSSRKNPFA